MANTRYDESFTFQGLTLVEGRGRAKPQLQTVRMGGKSENQHFKKSYVLIRMFYSIDTHVLNWPKSPFPKDKKTKREKFKKTKTRKRVLYCDVRAVRDVSYNNII